MLNNNTNLIKYSDKGLYCELADLWIDPHKPVKKALITHAHMDHFTFGCDEYISTYETSIILKERIGRHINIKTYETSESCVNTKINHFLNLDFLFLAFLPIDIN